MVEVVHGINAMGSIIGLEQVCIGGVLAGVGYEGLPSSSLDIPSLSFDIFKALISSGGEDDVVMNGFNSLLTPTTMPVILKVYLER